MNSASRLRAALMAALLPLAACQTMGPMPWNAKAPAPGDAPTASIAPVPATPAHVAILLPLTGPKAELGKGLLRAAKLGLSEPGAPVLDARDTGGTTQGAATAARAAVVAGDRMILGPLTASETASVAPIAVAARVPMLAFTSDPSSAQPGVWVLGLTPAQQVNRLLAAAREDGRSRFAALLPDNAFGSMLARAATTVLAGGPPPVIQFYHGGPEAMRAALRGITPPPGGNMPPGFDTLLIAESGERLRALSAMLTEAGVTAPQVRVIGPAYWGSQPPGQTAMAGAWYAAPDPAAGAAFAERYRARTNAAPASLADIAYDAANLVRVTRAAADPGSLARPDGFAGADGLLVLSPDGQTHRGLALFELEQGGSQLVSPAPQVAGGPGL